MSLSDNIKKFRQKQNLTQDQLAALLGMSPQAVSKWETGASIPDTAILVDLANALDTSLDTLFDNTANSADDLSQRIVSLLIHASKRERFQVAHELAWQIHRGLFYFRLKDRSNAPPQKMEPQNLSSYVLEDQGFTVVSRGKDPFFALFADPEEGYGAFLEHREKWQKILTALSDPHTIDALIYLFQKKPNHLFEDSILAKDCEIPKEHIAKVLNNLAELRLVTERQFSLNGDLRTLYSYTPNHKLFALLVMMSECAYTSGHCKSTTNRNKPLITATKAPEEA